MEENENIETGIKGKRKRRIQKKGGRKVKKRRQEVLKEDKIEEN